MNLPMADTLMPQNPEAEEAVLGSLLVDPQAIPRVASILKAEHFSVIKNGWVYTAILKLGERWRWGGATTCASWRSIGHI